jgi:hypothetical protein
MPSNSLLITTRTGKLKDLGNTLLGKVGLSLDNFKAVQDPGTGSYSISFQQQQQQQQQPGGEEGG